MKNGVISDIDYTLSIPTDRDTYDFMNSLKDKINPFIYNIISSIDTSTTSLLIVTGREEKFKAITKEFLIKNNITYHTLFMRKNDDNRSNEIIKKEIFINLIKPKWNILYTLDDNIETVKMYNSELGLNSLLVKNSTSKHNG